MSADTTTGRNPAVLLAIGLGVVALLAVLWFLVISPLLADDDADEPIPSQGSAQQTEQTTEPPTDAGTEPTVEATEAEELPVATYEVFLSRDPFQPVIDEDDSSDGGSDADSDGGSDGGSNGGSDGGSNGGSNGDDDPCPEDSAVKETSCEGVTVELIEVDEDGQGPFILVSVSGGTTTTERVGDDFGPLDSQGDGRFRVLDIFVDSGCARLAYVDDTFQICTGDRVLK